MNKSSVFTTAFVAGQTYTLPTPLVHWPWKSMTSKYSREAQAESVAWINSFSLFVPEAQNIFKKAEFGELELPPFRTDIMGFL